jgi:hypothetical protein
MGSLEGNAHMNRAGLNAFNWAQRAAALIDRG